MTARRLQNVAFVLLIMSCMTIYGAAKTRPISTAKLLVALAMAGGCYGFVILSNGAAVKEKSERPKDGASSTQSIKKESEQ